MLSHANIWLGAVSVAHYLGLAPQDRVLGVLPLSFDYGQNQLLSTWAAGAQVVPLDYLAARDVIRAVEEQGITTLAGVPPLWVQLIETPWPPRAALALRRVTNSGGRLPASIVRRLRELFPAAEVNLMYGLTEAFRSTYLDPAEVDRRPDSIGKAIPNAEILVVREDGSLCGPGVEGELVHRGALVALGYWNDPQRTAERFRPPPAREGGCGSSERAVWSGDRVVTDEDGFLYFVGRADEMIKTSGYRVSPTEIEEVVYETGLVRDAVALGIDDPRVGQQITLVVSPPNGTALDPEALLAMLRKQLPLYMVPRQVVVRPALPRSPNGKFDRSLLRRELTLQPAESLPS
jgi:acyl-CoA ligase (AMP-forming) (exosortase A-associated)